MSKTWAEELQSCIGPWSNKSELKWQTLPAAYLKMPSCKIYHDIFRKTVHPGHMDDDKIMNIISEYERHDVRNYQRAVHFRISGIFM